MTDALWAAITTVGDLRQERWGKRGNDAPISPSEVKWLLEGTGALWMHSGDLTRPHAALTSGKCSNGFVNVLKVLNFTNLCALLGGALARKLSDACRNPIGWVVGSDHAGATISYEVARCFGARHDFTEKGPNASQIWQRHEIPAGVIVLQIEELITTSGTLRSVRKGIEQGTPHPVTFAPVVGTVVNRSGMTDIDGSRIVSLLDLTINAWDPAVCPLCRAGSKRLRPKANWAELTGSDTAAM